MGVCPLSASRIIFQDCKKFHLICHDGSRFILVNVEPCWSLRCCRHSGQPLCSGPVCAHVEHCCPGCILEVVGTHCPGEWPRSPESCVSLSTCFLLPSRLSLQRTVCDCAEVPAEGYWEGVCSQVHQEAPPVVQSPGSEPRGDRAGGEHPAGDPAPQHHHTA